MTYTHMTMNDYDIDLLVMQEKVYELQLKINQLYKVVIICNLVSLIGTN